ncbi:hypothetical protein ACPEEZ_14420 [Frigoribacterium sp. 2-23]|uniref:hypothetical protein n=1 Tax=Frigoribacterium sp. 2-23 TaxID=3415006 RepID=UPI003C703D27
MSDDFDGETVGETDDVTTATESDATWTDAARGRLRRAADDLLAAIEAQTSALLVADSETGFEVLDLAGDEVDRAASAFSDAQFALSDEFFSLAEVTATDDDDDDSASDDLADDDSAATAEVVSVLQRADFAVTDVEAVLRAGREAYAITWAADQDDSDEGDDGHGDAHDHEHGHDAAEVERAELVGEPTDLGSALYEIAHAHGWAALDALDGLEPLGGIVEVIEPDEAIELPTDLDEFDDEDDDIDAPNELFSVDGRVLYTQFDIYGD